MQNCEKTKSADRLCVCPRYRATFQPRQVPHFFTDVLVTGSGLAGAELMSTPVGIVRDPVFFRNVKNVRVMNQTETVQVDRAGRRVEVRDLKGGRFGLDYDKLAFPTGTTPVVPPLPNVNLDNILTLPEQLGLWQHQA